MKAISYSAGLLLLRRSREATVGPGVRVLACAPAGIGSGRPRRTGQVRSEERQGRRGREDLGALDVLVAFILFRGKKVAPPFILDLVVS